MSHLSRQCQEHAANCSIRKRLICLLCREAYVVVDMSEVWMHTIHYMHDILYSVHCECVLMHVFMSPVLLQRWQKSGTHLEHLASRFCVDSEMALDGIESSKMLVISPCELSAHTQRWEMPFSWSFLLGLSSPFRAQLVSKMDWEAERASVYLQEGLHLCPAVLLCPLPLSIPHTPGMMGLQNVLTHWNDLITVAILMLHCTLRVYLTKSKCCLMR